MVKIIHEPTSFFFLLVCSAELWACSMILFHDSIASTCPIKDVILRRSPHRMFSVSHSNLINAGRPIYPPPQNKNSSDLHSSRGWPILISKRRISPKGDKFAGMRIVCIPHEKSNVVYFSLPASFVLRICSYSSRIFSSWSLSSRSHR